MEKLSYRAQQNRNIRQLGWALIGLALLALVFRFLAGSNLSSELPILHELLTADPGGYTALSGIFALLGVFCIGSVWQRGN